MEDIDFEGKIVKCKNGVYKCPYNCHDKRYPAPKWKSAKGFRSHINKCPLKPSYQAMKIKEHTIKVSKYALLQLDVLNNLKYKIGDKIAYVREIIVKDTHEWRGERRVKVRYEAVKRFDAGECTINSISFLELNPMDILEVGWITVNKLVFNSNIKIFDIQESIESASRIAAKLQADYDEHVRFSQMVR